MKKKLIIAALCAAVLAAPLLKAGAMPVFATESEPYTFETEQALDNEYSMLENGTFKLVKWNEAGNEITVPESFGGKSVTAIGAYAFGEEVKVISIPKSVTTIEDCAIGYLPPEEEGDEPLKLEGITIKCFANTAALTYAQKNSITADVHIHQYKLYSQTAPTCTADGKEVYRCECGESYTKSIAKLGHSYTKVKTVAPTLTAKGYTLYKCTRCGSQTKKNYTAMLKDVSKTSVSGVKKSYTYTGKAIKPNPKVKYGSTVLKKGTDYTVSYSANTKKGTAKITITGKGKYASKKVIKFKIAAAPISDAKVSGFKSYLKYNGKARKQSVTVKYGGKTLKSGTDYTVSYKNNVEIGTAQLIIKGKGNFKGTLTKKYKIVRTGWFKYKGNYYYYSNKGKKYTSGAYKIGDDYYYFAKSGVRHTGWQYIDGNYYLFDRKSGKRVTNATVDGIKINKNGTAVLNDWSRSKIATMRKAHSIMLEITSATDTMDQKRLKCFNWVLSFPYHQYRLLRTMYRQEGWEMTFANDIFDCHQGCCVAESAAVAFLFREIGYTEVYVCHDTSHSWVSVNGYIFDPVFAEAKDFWKNYNIKPYDYRVNPVDMRYIG